MNQMARMVRFSIRREQEGWRWETYDDRGARRTGGVVATKAIAAALVIRDTCAAQAPSTAADTTVEAEAA
ncbi:hypothetical protein [Caulobacter flavus]|nr:hypothetical protein [Caulobacter flavus]